MSNDSKYYKTKAFSKLQDKWYKKLEKAGFEDAESDEHHLKAWSSQFTRQKAIDSYEHKRQYYYMATHFLQDYKFNTELEKTIWEYHSEGISLTNIVGLLKKVKIKTYREHVWAIVKKLRASMYSLYGVTND